MNNRTLPYLMNSYGTVDISSAKNIEEALKISGMDWAVESRNIFDDKGNPYESYRANVRTTDDKLLGIVTNKYSIVQNWDAFEFVDGLVDEGFKLDRAGQFREGKSIWVMGTLPKANILGDDVSNNIVFVNSHDGSSGVKVMMTPVRLICYNMLNLALKKATRVWATKHTGSIYSKLEEAKYTLGLANKYMAELAIEAERLANIKVTDAEIEAIFDALYPIDRAKDSSRRINNVITLKNNFIECYNADDIAQFKGTAYGAVNAMSDLVSHKVPVRESESFYENSWNRLINGHAALDNFYAKIR